jgi:hypothetical protein
LAAAISSSICVRQDKARHAIQRHAQKVMGTSTTATPSA